MDPGLPILLLLRALRTQTSPTDTDTEPGFLVSGLASKPASTVSDSYIVDDLYKD